MTEEGIDICVRDSHSLRVYFLIKVTEEGIDICAKPTSLNGILKKYSDIEEN